MNRFLIIILIFVSFAVFAQEADTTTATKVRELETEIDSLQMKLEAMEEQMQEMRKNLVDGRHEVDEFLSIFGEKDVQTSDFEQRSRRKRVDALLDAISQRPGKLRFNGGATSIMQSVNDNNDWTFYGAGSFDIFAHTSFGPGTLLFIDMEAIGGNGPDQDYHTISGLNDDAGSTQSIDSTDRLTILEAWGEFSLFEEIITVTAGKIDLTNYYDNNASANDETMQFISGSFVNNSSFAVPLNSPGVNLRTTLYKKFHFQFAFASTDNSGYRLIEDVYKTGSLGWTFAPGTDLESNIRIYGYQHPLADYSYGWGVSVDKIVFKYYNIFGRFGQNQDELSDYWGIRSSWSAGTRFVKIIAKQPLAIGIAYGENYPSVSGLKTEKLMEVYIRRQFNQWIHLSPHFQYVWDAIGDSKNISIFGVRSHFNF